MGSLASASGRRSTPAALSASDGVRYTDNTMSRDLALIFVADGKIGDFLWVELDGAESSVNPARLKGAFPELLQSVVSNDARLLVPRSKAERLRLSSLLDKADTVIVDSPSVLRIFTKDVGVHACILERARSYLPPAG